MFNFWSRNNKQLFQCEQTNYKCVINNEQPIAYKHQTHKTTYHTRDEPDWMATWDGTIQTIYFWISYFFFPSFIDLFSSCFFLMVSFWFFFFAFRWNKKTNFEVWLDFIPVNNNGKICAIHYSCLMNLFFSECVFLVIQIEASIQDCKTRGNMTTKSNRTCINEFIIKRQSINYR